MGAGRFHFPFTLLLAFATALACTPFAAAQTEDPFCNTYTICIALIILVGIPLLMAYLKKKKEEELAAQHRPGVGQPGMAEPVPRGYEQTPSYGTTPYPSQPQGYTYAPQPQNIPGYPSAPRTQGAPDDYTPMMPVEEPAIRRKAAAPGACPRCGSKNIQNFETGEHKCLDCKKIYMD